MDNPGDAKYGFTTEQMFEGSKILKAKGVEHFGIHSFLASNTVTNDYYPCLLYTSLRTSEAGSLYFYTVRPTDTLDSRQ